MDKIEWNKVADSDKIAIDMWTSVWDWWRWRDEESIKSGQIPEDQRTSILLEHYQRN